MQPKASDLRPNRWYTAYHKATARSLVVMYMGISEAGMQFYDRDRNIYHISDFYFWKATE